MTWWVGGYRVSLLGSRMRFWGSLSFAISDPWGTFHDNFRLNSKHWLRLVPAHLHHPTITPPPQSQLGLNHKPVLREKEQTEAQSFVSPGGPSPFLVPFWSGELERVPAAYGRGRARGLKGNNTGLTWPSLAQVSRRRSETFYLVQCHHPRKLHR